MGLNEEVQQHVRATYINPAKQRGETSIRIKAGDIHRDLGWANRVPSVCTTLDSQKFQRETGLKLLSKQGPPSGYSTTVLYTYRLPNSEITSPQSELRGSKLDALYGILSDVYRELGGAENFIRSEREKLHFRKEEDGESVSDEDEP